MYYYYIYTQRSAHKGRRQLFACGCAAIFIKWWKVQRRSEHRKSNTPKRCKQRFNPRRRSRYASHEDVSAIFAGTYRARRRCSPTETPLWVYCIVSQPYSRRSRLVFFFTHSVSYPISTAAAAATIVTVWRLIRFSNQIRTDSW